MVTSQDTTQIVSRQVRETDPSGREDAGLADGTAETPCTYVLDSSVLLSDPRAILRFAEHAVVLPGRLYPAAS